MMQPEPELVDVGDGLHAYVQPDGSWGWSNAGLVEGAGTSLLVDTLFDLPLTRRMLDVMAPLLAGRPIGTVVNTHANADHCFGNQLVAAPGVTVVTSAATAAELETGPPRMPAFLAAEHPPPLRRFLDHAFGPFDFDGIDVPPVDRTFDGRLTLEVGDRVVELIQVGPAHTAGDVVAWVPDERVVFTGDICFVGGTPIMWRGPIANWINACDLVAGLAPAVVVPGHGPLSDVAAVRDVGDYLGFVRSELGGCAAAGLPPSEAVREVDVAVNGTRFGSWGDRERLVVTAHVAWQEIDPDYVVPDHLSMLRAMADDFVGRTSRRTA
jgi:glyoxylase-like metal-dependent hydrolase (beta-lactamase superfamily II)